VAKDDGLPPELSDEATGLPDLATIDPRGTVVVHAWVVTEGQVTLPDGEVVPVKFLHVRGLTDPTPEQAAQGATSTWTQLHVAVPADMVVNVSFSLATEPRKDGT
jgi:hypothetical protein